MPHFFRSTYIVAALTLLIGLVVNCGGEVRSERNSIEHGWPWGFAIRDVSEIQNGGGFIGPDYQFFHPSRDYWWRLDKAETWRWGSLAADAVVLVLIATGLAALWELRRRRRGSLWQFSMLDGLAAITVIAAACGYWRTLVADRRADRQVEAAFRQVEGFSQRDWSDMRPPTAPLDPSCDVPCDWLWGTLGIPCEQRPYFRRTLMLFPHDEVEVPREALQSLARLSHLERLCIFRLADGDELLRSLPTLPRLCELDLHDMRMTRAGIAEIKRFRSLKSLDLFDVKEFDGAGLSELKQVVGLRELRVANAPLAPERISELTAIVQLRELAILPNKGTAAGSWGDLPRLRQLKKLWIRYTPLSTADLAAVGELRSLRELYLFAVDIDDQGMLEIARLNRLTTLDVSSNPRITDAGLKQLAQLPSLQSLKVNHTGVSAGGIAELQAARPKLAISAGK